MALGWGLWEGPARFIFWDQVLIAVAHGPTYPQQISRWTLPLDFKGKWHNIRHEDEVDLIRLRINEAADHPLSGRFATVAALPSARCGIFRAAANEWVCCRDEKWPH